MKPHRWHNIIQAWLDGEVIQYQSLSPNHAKVWVTYDNQSRLPNFNSEIHIWRIKPKAAHIRYIKVLHKSKGGGFLVTVCNTNISYGFAISRPSYVKTLGTWVNEEIDLEA